MNDTVEVVDKFIYCQNRLRCWGYTLEIEPKNRERFIVKHESADRSSEKKKYHDAVDGVLLDVPSVNILTSIDALVAFVEGIDLATKVCRICRENEK